ncbi:unknown [Bacteroides sp. CAG:443]|nr:unknown [Bacteroides sp. CAG:443]
MALDVVRCHQMSYEGQERTGTEEKKEKKKELDVGIKT